MPPRRILGQGFYWSIGWFCAALVCVGPQGQAVKLTAPSSWLTDLISLRKALSCRVLFYPPPSLLSTSLPSLFSGTHRDIFDNCSRYVCVYIEIYPFKICSIVLEGIFLGGACF